MIKESRVTRANIHVKILMSGMAASNIRWGGRLFYRGEW